MSVDGSGLVGCQLAAIQHRDACFGQLADPGLLQNGRQAGQLAGIHLAAGHVHDGQHGVGLAAAERRLQLDHRVAALARQALHHRAQQYPHALR